MRKITLFIFLAVILCAFTGNANAQISVSGGTGLNPTYTTLTGTTGLFAAINATAQTGNNIVVSITGDVTEVAVAADSLCLKPGAWASITISPSGGATRTISGAAAAGFALLKFNGADNVTINGLNTGGNALIIQNTTNSATSGTSTIRFVDGATNNTITNCTIKGSFSAAVGTNGGTIFFATDGVTANGNDNNTISNCDITAAGSNLPTKGIYGNGSTGTTAIGNSGILINNNNFYDIFGAAVTSSMIYTAGGCNGWTISNNRFYQVGTRTWTTGAQHSAIWLTPSTATSGVQDMRIFSNIIGYASNTQTGTYTLTGSTGKFIAIFISAIGSGTSNRIALNKIASVSLTGVTSSGTGSSTPFGGVMVTSGTVNVDSNSIGSQSATGNLTFSTNTTTATDVYGIYNVGSDAFNVRGDTLGGITANNAGASGAFIFYGIRVNTVSSVASTITNNIIGGTVANSISSNSTSTTAQLIGFTNTISISLDSANTIRNITGAGGTGTSGSASVIGMNYVSTSVNNVVARNIIYALGNTNSSAATTVCGIQYTASSGTNTVERNFIHSLTNSSTAGIINGINVSGGTTTYKNNMIRLGLDASGSSITTSAAISGISEPLGTDNFYNNSVYVGGTSVVSGTVNTYAFNSQQTTNTRVFQNNIFWNHRSNTSGTGKHYGIRVGGTTVNPTGLTSNYNVVYVDGTGGTFGFFNSADVASLASWRTATGQDANSISNSSIQFIAPDGTSSTVDLHLHATNPTVCEGSGVSIGAVTDDYDGQTRSGLTPTDIGADAGNFVALDVSGPSISYSALGSIPASINQTLSATISDASGVPQAGANQPTLYYKSTTSVPSYTAVTGSWVSGNTYTFSFGASVTSAGETVSYYIVAQDNAGTPNLSCSPSGGAAGLTANPPTAGTPPTTPSTYTTVGTLSGTKTVGSGGDYATLKAAFDDVNLKVLTGNLTLSILSGGTTETSTASLNQVSYYGGTYTLTISPASGQTPTITGSLTGVAVVKLNGADNVVIDGSNSGGTDKSLTITNSGTGATTTAIWVASQGTGAGCTGNTIKNCLLSTSASAVTSYGIYAGGTTLGSTTGADNDNLTIQNNTLSGGISVGIYAIGTASSSTGGNDNLNINNNSVTVNTTTTTTNYGIEVGNSLTSNIYQNSLSVTNSAAGQPVAISLETGFVSSNVYRNLISTVNATNTNGYGGRGITVGTGTATSSLTISNNVIYGVNGSNWNTFGGSSSAGIWIGVIGNSGTLTTTTGGVNLYFNSVNMTGSMGSASTTAITAALYVGSGASALDIRNNIFANAQTATNTGQKNYGIYCAAANSAFSSIDYNDYYVINSFNAGSAIPGFIGSDRTNLAGIQSGFGSNTNSTISDPVYTSTTDLNISQSGAAYHTGVNGTGITIDYTGATRNNPPSMGAYDAGVNTGPSISYTPLGNSVASTNQVLTAAIVDAIDGVPQAGLGLPTLYYKSTTSVPSYIAVQGVYVSGNNYSFTFGSSVTGTGETVSYYIVAQDNAGLITQVSCSPSAGASGFSVNPPAVSTPPTTPSTYNTVAAFSGTKTIGSGGDYATIAAAVTALNGGTVTGAVTFNLLDASYSETYPITINTVTGGSVTNTVTFKPTQTGTTVTGTSASGGFILSGADYVTFDGSTSGGTDKNLTIANTNTSGAVMTFQNGASKNTLKNCKFNGVSTATTNGVLTFSTTTGTGNDSNTIQNNDIGKGGTSPAYGIFNSGSASPNKNTFNTFTGNRIFDFTNTGIRDDANSSRFVYTGNEIFQNANQSTALVGFRPGATSIDGFTFTRNYIHDLKTTSTGSVYGIHFFDISTADSGVVSNNVISISETAPLTVYGIYDQSATSEKYMVYYNSVYLGGSVTGASNSRAYNWSIASTSKVRNNIFVNARSGGSGKHYAIAYNTTYANITSDYNCIYNAGGTGNVFGYDGTVDRTTIAAFRTATGKETNSVNGNPQFASTTTLVPVSSGTGVIYGLNMGNGSTTATSVDFNGASRSSANPDMGAYEFTASIDLTGLGNTTLPAGTYNGLTWTGNTCTFSGDVTVDGTLNLTNGVIDMGANTLTIGTSAGNTGNLTRSGGSIKGIVKRWFGTNTTTNSVFPLDYGDGANYVGASISFTGAPSTGGTLTAQYFTSGAGNFASNGGAGFIDVGGLWPGVNFINVASQYWRITAGDGLAGYTYDITLIGNNMNVSSTGYLYTGIIKRTDNTQPWGWNQSNHVNTTSPSAIPTLAGTGFTTFSDFGIGGNVDNLLPVELSSFTANVDRRFVTLNWGTSSEQNNVGYDIERKPESGSSWSKVGFVAGKGTTNNASAYTYQDRNLVTGKYNYRLKQMDNNGNYKYYVLSSLVEVGVPTKYDMSQNYPNPFNPTTKINYDLPFDSKVSIRLFDMTGREVAIIVNATQTAGYYTAQFNGSNLASGVYFYNITAEGGNAAKFVTTKKMVLVK